MHPKFDEVYEELIFEQYDLDADRREILKPTWYWTGINVSLLMLSIALLTTNWLMSLALVGVVVWSIVQHARVRKRRQEQYDTHYREHIVKPTVHAVVACYENNGVPFTCKYVPDEMLYDDIIDASPLAMYKGHTRSGRDFISGTYRGLYYKGSVVTLYKDPLDEQLADPQTLVAFEGTLLRVELPQAFNGTHRIVSGTFAANNWKTMLNKQVSLVTYKTLLKKDAQLKHLPVTNVTDTPFQERFKVHTSDEKEIEALLVERVQQELLSLVPALQRHDVLLQILVEGEGLYIVLQRNRYVAEERMHLSLDDEQLRTIYTGLVLQFRVVEAFDRVFKQMKKTSESSS